MLYYATAFALALGAANGMVLPRGGVPSMNAAEAAAKAKWLAARDAGPSSRGATTGGYTQYDDHKFPAQRLGDHWSHVPLPTVGQEALINDDHKFPAQRLGDHWSHVPLPTVGQEALINDDHKYPAQRLGDHWSHVPLPTVGDEAAVNDDHKFPAQRVTHEHWSYVPITTTQPTQAPDGYWGPGDLNVY